MNVLRPSWVEVDLGQLRQNYRQVRSWAEGQEVMAVVKANAYGHGALRCARALSAEGIGWFGVAVLSEAHELRRAGITQRILILGHLAPVEMPLARRLDVDITCSDVPQADLRGLRVHLKVDTGMGRLGGPPSKAMEILEGLRAAGAEVDGIFTHLAAADSDDAYTRQQLESFGELVQRLQQRGTCPPWIHALNSAGTMKYGGYPGNLVRSGAALYGLNPDGLGPPPPGLRPILALKARVSFVKQVPAGTPLSYGLAYRTRAAAKIATLPIGYADGYRRILSNRGQVLVAGHRRPVVGRVTMDQLLVELPPSDPTQAGDEAVLIGRQGQDVIRAEEVAVWANTVNYEVVAGLSARLPRQYRGGRRAPSA